MDKATLILRLTLVIEQLDVMHEQAVIHATSMGVEPREVRYPSGEYVLAPIFIAQANALAALANLQTDI